MKRILTLALISATAVHSYAAPAVQIRLPERFRLLTDQLFDLRVEATGLTNPATASIQVLVNGAPATLPAPEVTTDNDANAADGDKAWTYRASASRAKA